MSPKRDDHPDKWEYQQHTRAKHDVLHYYLKIWTSIVSNENYPLRIFDCFAGRGGYYEAEGVDPKKLDNISTDTKIPGSPQIIMNAVSEHSDKFESAECYFLEPNRNNRNDLETNLEKTETPDNVNPYVKDAKFPDDIPSLIRRSGGKEGFAFFFIDPYNIKYLDYVTITDIASFSNWSGGFECLITLMTGQLIRWQDSRAHQKGYENLFGTPNWQNELEKYQPEQLETREAEYYCQRLMESGPEYTLAYMTTEGESRKLKYHLVFTTNSEDGLEYMRESMYHQGTNYALAFAPHRAEASFKQTGIDQFTPSGKLSEKDLAKSHLLARFEGETMGFDEVVSGAIAERPYAESRRPDYRQYLKDLHAEGEVEIPQRDDNALKEDWLIHFPGGS